MVLKFKGATNYLHSMTRLKSWAWWISVTEARLWRDRKTCLRKTLWILGKIPVINIKILPHQLSPIVKVHKINQILLEHLSIILLPSEDLSDPAYLLLSSFASSLSLCWQKQEKNNPKTLSQFFPMLCSLCLEFVFSSCSFLPNSSSPL